MELEGLGVFPNVHASDVDGLLIGLGSGSSLLGGSRLEAGERKEIGTDFFFFVGATPPL